MTISIPPLPIQRKIAAILSAYDDLIENNTRRIAILEEMARAIYQEWFVRFRFPGHERVRMVPSPLGGEMPEGWDVVKLGDIAGINQSSTDKTWIKKTINYIDISSVSVGRIERTETMSFLEAPGRARRIIQHGDIIWSMVRPNRKSYSLILFPRPDTIASTGFATISSKSDHYAYLYQALTTDAFVTYLSNHATGAAYPAVTANDFLQADILRPSETLLEKFQSIVASLYELQQSLQMKNANLRRTRDLLLPKLVAGEIDVSEMDVAMGDVG